MNRQQQIDRLQQAITALQGGSANITPLALAGENANLWTPTDALIDALKSIGVEGAFREGKKLLILALDDNDDRYHISFTQANLSMSEILALLEAAKTIILQHMELIPYGTE